MEFDDFLRLFTKLKKNKVDAGIAHSLLAPNIRDEQIKQTHMEDIKPKNAAVLLLVYPNTNGEMSLLLIRRNQYKGTHSRQISFPGGKLESQDIDLWSTALRETFEEVGISSNQIFLIRPLSQLYVPPSNFLISPFLAYTKHPCEFVPDRKEVDKIIEIPLKNLISTEPFMTKQYSSSLELIYAPAYIFDQDEVWGATAMILSEFKMLLIASLFK